MPELSDYTPKDRVIGIIGGMGPYAGLDLVKKVFDQTLAHSDHAHLPVALLSYPERIPDRSPFLFGETDLNPAPRMAEIVRRLESVGAVVAAIPCNTAHGPAIFDALELLLRASGSRVRLLHMIRETARHLHEAFPGVRRVGILATNAVQHLHLYEDALRQYGFEAFHPKEPIQTEKVNRTIFDETWGIKGVANPVSERARRCLLDAIEHLRGRGAEAVVLGCTELPLAVPEAEWAGAALVDPTVVVARALIRETYPEQLRPL